MALYQPYCTADDVHGHTKNFDIATDVTERSINMASRYVDEYTGRLFHYYDHSSTAYKVPNVDFIGGTHIYLPFPILSLASVSAEEEEVDSDNYEFSEKPSGYKHRSVLELKSTVTIDFLGQKTISASSNAEVKGTFGFTSTNQNTVPDDTQFPAGIRRATTLIASAFSEHNRKEQIALDGTRVAVASYNVPDEATDILNMHKRQVIV